MNGYDRRRNFHQNEDLRYCASSIQPKQVIIEYSMVIISLDTKWREEFNNIQKNPSDIFMTRNREYAILSGAGCECCRSITAGAPAQLYLLTCLLNYGIDQ
jgi:hypothetical protein